MMNLEKKHRNGGDSRCSMDSTGPKSRMAFWSAEERQAFWNFLGKGIIMRFLEP